MFCRNWGERPRPPMTPALAQADWEISSSDHNPRRCAARLTSANVQLCRRRREDSCVSLECSSVRMLLMKSVRAAQGVGKGRVGR